MIGVVFILVICFTAIYLPTALISQDWLNYSSVQKIYSGEKVNLKYNTNYPNNQTNLIAQSIVASQDGYIEATSEDWVKDSATSYQDFFTEISEDLDENMAAYWIDASQIGNTWNINAVIFANATSPATVPTFGNLLLQSIAQTISGEQELSLEFEYTAYD